MVINADSLIPSCISFLSFSLIDKTQPRVLKQKAPTEAEVCFSVYAHLCLHFCGHMGGRSWQRLLIVPRPSWGYRQTVQGPRVSKCLFSLFALEMFTSGSWQMCISGGQGGQQIPLRVAQPLEEFRALGSVSKLRHSSLQISWGKTGPRLRGGRRKHWRQEGTEKWW